MSPLIKRIPRQLRSNLGKYLGIFLLMFVCIAMTSGFLLAAHSIIRITDDIPATYHLEDGRLTTSFEATKAQLKAAEDAVDDAGGVTFYKNYSITTGFKKTTGDDGKARRVRATVHEERINVAAYAQGRAPRTAHEIALDRVFAENVGVGVGDEVRLGGRTFAVCGIMTLPDSQALFEDNADFTLNAVTFGVAEMAQSGMRTLENAGCEPTYTYSFRFADRSLSVSERTDAEKDMVKSLEKKDAQVTDLIDASSNQGIGYVADDARGDSAMWSALLYIIIVIMAFAFVVLTNATIEEESAVIGTLMASGYRKGELLRHYVALPALVGLVACVLGAVVGVCAMEQPMASIYYNSYSLPPYRMSWDWSILVQTAVIPYAVLLVITFFGVLHKLNHTPLQFLRREIGRHGTKRGVRLPSLLKFATRFRIRVFLRNIGSYLTLFVGIAFASTLLLFGISIMPTMTHYADNLRDNVVAAHEYTLKAPLELDGTAKERAAWEAVDRLQSVNTVKLTAAEKAANRLENIADDLRQAPSPEAMADLQKAQRTLNKRLDAIADDLGVSRAEVRDLLKDASRVDADDEDAHPVNTTDNGAKKIAQAEKYAVYPLDYDKGEDNAEPVSVYGISPDSQYWKGLKVGDSAVVLGRGMMGKFGLKAGDTIKLYDKYEDKTYRLTVSRGENAVWGSMSDMSVYLSLKDFNKLFDHDADYFNAYASNASLKLDGRYVQSDLTPADMDKIGDQMTDSMGDMVGVLEAFAVFIYFVFIYLLTKTVIDHSARPISYLKVFGYRNREVSKLYIRSMTWCVVVSLVASLPVVVAGITAIFRNMLMAYNGNIEIYVPNEALFACIVAGFVTYAVVALLHMHTIRKVPLSIALKAQG